MVYTGSNINDVFLYMYFCLVYKRFKYLRIDLLVFCLFSCIHWFKPLKMNYFLDWLKKDLFNTKKKISFMEI